MGSSSEFDYLLKILLIGDCGFVKNSLGLSLTSNNTLDDFKVQYVTVGDKKLKLVMWDTGVRSNLFNFLTCSLSLHRCLQERFRTLTSEYYRGAHGIIMAYDVTRRETFTNLAREIKRYSTNHDCAKMLVGNKVDEENDRTVSTEEGIDFAREHGCLFVECSAKTRVYVEQCFEELVLKILETPSLLAQASFGGKKNIFKQNPAQTSSASSTYC